MCIFVHIQNHKIKLKSISDVVLVHLASHRSLGRREPWHSPTWIWSAGSIWAGQPSPGWVFCSGQMDRRRPFLSSPWGSTKVQYQRLQRRNRDVFQSTVCPQPETSVQSRVDLRKDFVYCIFRILDGLDQAHVHKKVPFECHTRFQRNFFQSKRTPLWKVQWWKSPHDPPSWWAHPKLEGSLEGSLSPKYIRWIRCRSNCKLYLSRQPHLRYFGKVPPIWALGLSSCLFFLCWLVVDSFCRFLCRLLLPEI